MKPIVISFEKGIQFPPKLGSLILKPSSEGRAGYAQNVDISNDEYGNEVVVPGPALGALGNNSELTGIPAVKQNFSESATPNGYVYFGQSILGTKTIIRRIKDVLSGSTPVIDSGVSATINHSNHTNQQIVDIVYRSTGSGNFDIYVAGKDDTDTWVYKFSGNSGSISPNLIQANLNFTSGYTDQFLVPSSFDNNLYWIGQQRVSSFDVSDTYTVAKLALGLPVNTYASCGADWQQQLLVAYTDAAYGGFSQRLVGGKAGLAIWDYNSPKIIRNIPAPCRYISALIPSPDGQLLAFGGIDSGKSSIYTFTGYGFRLLTQYIGDMPRSRHSVEFDGQGRIVWLTADGFLCRYDLSTGIFENLGRTYSTGGLLAKGIGSPTGNEFFVGSGQGSTYELDVVSFGSYAGDNNGTDSTNTPMAVSGNQVLPINTSISAATLNLAKPLESGEKVVLRIYKNGSTTDYVDYLTMDYSADGAISSKREAITLDNINSFNAAVIYKMNSGNTTAPPVLNCVIEPQETI